MVTNAEIRKMFGLYAELLQLHEQDDKFSSYLSGAAYRIRRTERELLEMTKPELSKLFAASIVKLLVELKKNGTIAALDELVQLTPPGLFDMMRIRGLGGKKLAVLWKQAKIDNVEDLLHAAKSDRLSDIPGFGSKTQTNIINAIENLNANKDRFHFADVADAADAIVDNLQRIFKTKMVSLCGEVRRQTLTVQEIEILIAVPAKKFTAAALRRILHIGESTSGKTTAHTLDEMPVAIYHTTPKNFYTDLFTRTGNEQHIAKVQKLAGSLAGISEEAIYKKAGLPFIVPELRENVAEWEFVKKKKMIW